MASLDLKQIDHTLVIRRARTIRLKVGLQGPPGPVGPSGPAGGLTAAEVLVLIDAAIAEAVGGGVIAPRLSVIDQDSTINANTIFTAGEA